MSQPPSAFDRLPLERFQLIAVGRSVVPRGDTVRLAASRSVPRCARRSAREPLSATEHREGQLALGRSIPRPSRGVPSKALFSAQRLALLCHRQDPQQDYFTERARQRAPRPAEHRRAQLNAKWGNRFSGGA